jgi:hypothetical protein
MKGHINVVSKKTNSYEPKSNLHMNQCIDHIENFVQESTDLLLSMSTQFAS